MIKVWMKKKASVILFKISQIIWRLIPHQSKFDNLETKLKIDLVEETFINFKDHIKKSVLFWDNPKIRKYAITTALLNDINKEYYYLEFGVWKGETANFFSKSVNKFYCFDSFEGLQEDWEGSQLPKGAFDLKKKIPKLNSNIIPIVGWVEDTLDDFLKTHNPKINFVHMDFDTYTPTKFTLEKLKPYLVKNAIILFDQLYHYHGWKDGEYKAFKEVFKENEFKYKAFMINSALCAVQIK